MKINSSASTKPRARPAIASPRYGNGFSVFITDHVDQLPIELVVDLAGEAPVPIVGTILNHQAGDGDPAEVPIEFELLLSEDGSSWESVLTDSAQEDEDFGPSRSVAELKLRSVLALPLEVHGIREGCLYLDNRFQDGTFEASHQRLMELFANQGKPLQVKSGDATITLTDSGDVQIKGNNITIEATSNLDLKGVNVVAAGQSKFEAKGATVDVKASGTGTIDGGGVLNVKGGMVKLN